MDTIRALAKAAMYKVPETWPARDEMHRVAREAFQRFMSPERALAMQDVIDAAEAMRKWIKDVDRYPYTADEFDAALARLEGI